MTYRCGTIAPSTVRRAGGAPPPPPLAALCDDTAACADACRGGFAGKLGREARLAILGDLVAAGQALWFDRGQRQALVLWRTIPEWAAAIAAWARGTGMEGAVLSLADLTSGVEVRGSELEGLHPEVLLRALRLLEQGGKCRLFRGGGADDEGVKFGHSL